MDLQSVADGSTNDGATHFHGREISTTKFHRFASSSFEVNYSVMILTDEMARHHAPC